MKKIFSIILSVVALSAGSANASVIINVTEVGGNVVFDVSGSLNLTGAVAAQSGVPYSLGFISGGSNWYIATGNGSGYQGYAFTSFDGPFGTNLNFFSPPTSSSGDNFFIWGQGGATEQVAVGPNYISGSAISSGMIFAGSTIAGFGMTSGIYNYNLPNDSVQLRIGQARVVPEPSTYALLGLGLLGIGIASRMRSNS